MTSEEWEYWPGPTDPGKENLPTIDISITVRQKTPFDLLNYLLLYGEWDGPELLSSKFKTVEEIVTHLILSDVAEVVVTQVVKFLSVLDVYIADSEYRIVLEVNDLHVLVKQVSYEPAPF